MKIHIVQGDITALKVDAIVNAANSSLLGGGGVDGAIHRAGGPAILAACKKIRAEQGECASGDAVYTEGGNLAARFVIHTVGPIWAGGNRGEAATLIRSYTRSMQIAEELKCKSIAFPNISTGVYGFPKEKAAKIVGSLFTNKTFLAAYPTVQDIFFVNFDNENYELYKKVFA